MSTVLFCVFSRVDKGALTDLRTRQQFLSINISAVMPGQESVNVTISPQKSSFVLKKIMNIPPPNILQDQDDGKQTFCVQTRYRITICVSTCIIMYMLYHSHDLYQCLCFDPPILCVRTRACSHALHSLVL